ncbi:Holliday junction branch migration protein RuvA [Leucobacter sp. W1153]|uniref:Holliday junction branch migration protein RuvA n=1 Tax=unclassified Leucobacter TaxID=2621730 RepID=UPI003F3008B0
MIASIRGEVLSAGPGWVVVSVGGVGLRVEVPSGRVGGSHPGEEIFLHTSLIVREDSLTLFGFSSTDDLEVFGHLLAVSGVGPRSALGVLAEMSPAEIAAAVHAEDEKPFRKVSGIGPKTAKLIAVSLAGKVTPQAYGSQQGAPHVRGEQYQPDPVAVAVADVEQALIGLGYSEAQSEGVVRDAIEAGAASESSALLRAALALLQTPRSPGRAAPRKAAQ